MLILTNLDFNGAQLLNVVLQVLAAPPPSPQAGQIYYDSSLHKARIYNGAAWDDAGGSGDASLLNGQPGTYYLNFANTTGARDHTAISDFDAQVRAARLDELASPIGVVSLAGQRLTDLADPTSDQDAATQAYVLSRIDTLVNSAPGVLDTLAELATALGDDPNFAATMAAQIAAAKDRSNHTGTQLSGTISDFTTAVDTQILGKMAVADIGDGSTTTFTVTHNLGTRDLHVQVRQNSDPWNAVIVDWRPATVNAIELSFLTAPAVGAYRVTISRAG
ncbi:hypothetical protein K2Z83_13425 [Oscillochloris sp. ZM17-4]|uniref:hypothetical protein n=1 Tax=Oscillochloris sp. ZM17-4 TaxID=2866714 RepID=UPI001C731056|nr:hypothetical protein [Oscillochloris sp. ZM17-4]MBX0328677.1 hypothetical protein [Oscillochloris sp. ZM17-4]